MATIADQAPALERGNVRLNEADNPSSLVARFGPDEPLLLDSGHRIDFLQIAYQTYGTLDRERRNAILKFRQGVGRLIRTKTDRGVIVVLDNRIVTKPYGRSFLRALPKCPVEII